jgi:uroporphyrinogen-III synthase
VVVTSASAVGPVVAGLARAGLDPAALRWAAVGPTSADRLRAFGIADVFVPGLADATALGTELPVEPGTELLLPRSDLADAALPEALRARRARVREVIAYRTVEAPAASRPQLAAVLDDGPVDVILATSASTARGFVALADEPRRHRVLATPVIAAGTRAAEGARGAGFNTVLTATAPDPASLAAFTAEALGLPPVTPQPGAVP